MVTLTPARKTIELSAQVPIDMENGASCASFDQHCIVLIFCWSLIPWLFDVKHFKAFYLRPCYFSRMTKGATSGRWRKSVWALHELGIDVVIKLKGFHWVPSIYIFKTLSKKCMQMQSGGSRKKMIADTCMQIDTGHRKGSSKNEPSEFSKILKLLATKRCIHCKVLWQDK